MGRTHHHYPFGAAISGRFSPVAAAAANLAAAAMITPITAPASAAAVLCLPWPPRT